MPHELDDLVVETRRRVSDPSQHFEILQRAALDDLLGLPALSPLRRPRYGQVTRWAIPRRSASARFASESLPMPWIGMVYPCRLSALP